MEVPNISGKWTGVIVYGQKYREYNGKELYFDAELTQKNNSLSGTVIDTGGTGISPDPATISGFFSSDIISFVKRYKSHHYIDRGNVIIEKNKEGYPIYYTGIYDESTKTFNGNWEYRIRIWILGIIPFRYKFGGTWTMRRK